MAGSLNKVTLIGRLGRDPEVRRTGAGDPVVSFSIATSETWKDKATGERKERTDWANVVIFNEKLGEVAERYLKKGSQCYLVGKLQTREYTDRDGNQRKVTEVVLQRFHGELVLLDSQGGGRAAQDDYGTTTTRETKNAYAEAKGRVGQPTGGRMDDVTDHDIPF